MKNIKKLVTMLCVFAMCFSITALPAMAMEIPAEKDTDVSVCYVTGNNSFTYYKNSSASVRISGSPSRVRSTPSFNGLLHDSGTVVLKFTGRNTGNVFTLAFECNSTTTITRDLAFDIATDTYDVTTAYMGLDDLNHIIIDFM